MYFFSHLYKGWSLLSLGASKIAETAKENATRLGSIASQKVCVCWMLFSQHFILLCRCFLSMIFNRLLFLLKVKEGGILEDVGSHVSVFASKVCYIWAMIETFT